MARLYLAGTGIHVAQLLLTSHFWMAGSMMLLAAGTWLAWRQVQRRGPTAPRRLLLTADGRLCVACVDGAMQQVKLAGESMWLGGAVLLVLEGAGCRHRLLLGRGNLDPAVLATLRRRLRGAAPAPGDTAIDSEADSRHRASAVEHFTSGT